METAKWVADSTECCPKRRRTLGHVGDETQPPSHESSSDVELAAGLATGSAPAFADLYDRYCDRIYSYCHSLCRNPDLAAAAMADTFLLAFGRIAQLRDPSKLHLWQYAIARNESLRQMRANKGAVDLERIAVAAQVDADADAPLSAADARVLVDEAFAGLNSSDRDVLDLALRQRLDNNSIAAVLRVSDNTAAAKLSHAKSELEAAVGALLLFRTLPRGCEQLDAQIGPDQQFTALSRKRISRHALTCPECSKSRAKSVAAIELVGLPVIVAPSWIRETLLNSATPAVGGPAIEVVRTLPDKSTPQPFTTTSSGTEPIYIAENDAGIPPLSVTERAAKLDRKDPPFGKDGWPITGKTGKRRWPLVVALSAVVVLMAAAAGVAITGGSDNPAPRPTQSQPTASASVSQPSSAP